jgi:DNA-binding winged helix-turn-helix (wHTH) protein/tetratricopeptide (TPR) repeat protein
MTDPLRPPPKRVEDFRVGAWLAEPALNRLTSGPTVLRIRPQLMDVLVCLARHQGRVVLKDELLAEVWPDRIITESGMVRCIAELRQILGDDSREPRYIETISKRGYRLLTPVEWLPDGPAHAPGGEAAAGEPGAATEGAGGPGDAGTSVPQDDAPVPAAGADARTVPAAPRRAGRRRRWLAWAAVLAALAGTATALVLYLPPSPPGLTERDTIVLAFDNATSDPVFGETLPLALAVQLEQSPFLRVLAEDQVRGTIAEMQRPPDTVITRAVGAEVCERAGATVLIAGSIAPLGRTYALGLEAVSCATGEALARQQAEAAGKDQVLGALGRIASALRRQLGESRDSVGAYDVPLTQATTPSIEALRALRRGDAARDRGQGAEALQFYREAVALDPACALAHSRLGGTALGHAYEQEALTHLARAYELRDRVTLPERLEIDLIYHSVMTGDRDRMTATLEAMRQAYPRRLSARRRLAILYMDMGRFAEALTEATEALRLEPRSALAHQTVVRAYEALGRYAEARQVAEAAIAAHTDTVALHVTLLHIGFLTEDAALVARERAWAATRDAATPVFLEAEAEEAVWRGRLLESLEYLNRYQAWVLQRGAAFRWIVLELRKARFEALCGFSDRARRRTAAQLARGDELGNDLLVDALKASVSAGDFDTVSRILDRLARRGWPKVEQPFAGFVLSYRAALETGRGRPRRALEILRAIQPYELGVQYGLIPLYERAVAHLAAGEWQQARDAFQKMLDHAGVFTGQKLMPAAQLGLARALAAGGDTDASRRAYEQFFAWWKGADADLPLLAQARREAGLR